MMTKIPKLNETAQRRTDDESCQSANVSFSVCDAGMALEFA